MNADDTGRGKAGRGGRESVGAENPSRSRQDLGLKGIFAQPPLGADFLLTFKPEYAKRLDLNTLEPHPTELVSPTLDLRIADIVLRVNEKAEPGKARAARAAEHRVSVAAGPDDAGADGASGGVVSLVLYTGRARWTVPVYLEGEQGGEFSAAQQLARVENGAE